VARQQAKIERERERKQRAEELAAQRALKKQQREAAPAQKARDRENKRKRTASYNTGQNTIKRRRGVAASSRVDAGPPEASPHPNLAKPRAKSRR
jgi:hypothetical protein